MRFSGFRSAHGLLALSAFVLLTGAKAPEQGCGFGGVVVEEPPAPPPVDPKPEPTCEPGFHPETICEGGGTGSTGVGGDCYGHDAPESDACKVTCVPDSPCGPGHHEEWVCEDVGTTTASTGGGYGGGYGGGGPEPMPAEPAPPPGGCYPICVPDSPCPAGSREQYICDEYGSSSSVGGVGGGHDGGYGGGYGGYEADSPPSQGSCYYACVYDDTCPPGTYPETFCSGSSATGAGGDAPVYEYEESCWTECVDGGTTTTGTSTGTTGGYGGGGSTSTSGVGGSGAAG